MRKRFSIIAAVAVAGAAFGDGAADQLPEIDRLPDDTVAYLFRTGWSETTQKLAGTPSGTALSNARVQEFFAQMRLPASRKSPRADLFAFAFDGMHEELIIAAREMLDGGQPVSRHFAIATPIAERRSHFDGLYNALKGQPGMTTAREAGWPIEFARIGDPGLIHIGWDGKRAIVADSSEAASWAVAAKSDKPLDKSAVFRAAIDPLFAGQASRPIALYYYDFRSWWPRLDAAPEAVGWSESSWRSLDTISGATFVENGRFRNRHYWKLGSRRTGLFKHTQAARINREWLKRVPTDATGLTTGVWDPAGFVPTLAALSIWILGTEPEHIRGVYQFGPDQNPIATTFASLANRYLVYRLPNRYGAGPLFGTLPNAHLVAFLEIKNREGFLRALEALLPPVRGTLFMGPSMMASTWDGTAIRTISLFYVTLYIAILDDVAIVTINPQLLKDAIDAYKRPAPSIVDTEPFRAVQKDIPDDACFLMYFPPGGFARGIYDEFVPALMQYFSMVQAFTGRGDPTNSFDPLFLPRGRDIIGDLRMPTIITARDDGQAIIFDGTAPLLSMSYYWPYVHALMHINEHHSSRGMWPVLTWLVGDK